ncbi:hypothetical protein EDD22DRAFT_817284 [Suillus occidentalis]|nr:hypothetical protein EDD22DRAFT_817284 [Suillus occidentalis]
MSSLPICVDCLLPAENLRCGPLSFTQIYTLAIPPVIELLFCIFLISMTWRSRRALLLLAADGTVYFILALVDLLPHVIPAARNSVTATRMAQLFLGSVSSIPMLSYTSYLVWLSHREFIPYLPRRHQHVAKYLLIGLIPVGTIMNFAASLGLTIHNLHLSQPDFTSKSGSLWLSLGQLSLGLYTNYQCLAAFLALYRLFIACFDQRRIDTENTDERHFFNGTGWIALGIKLGAAECFVGFASGGFSIPLSRRILRLISRACIIFGTLKGMDENQNFELLTKELVLWRRGKPLSNSHSLIANRHMSIRFSQFMSGSPIEKDAEKGEAVRRVTVHNEGGGPPVLHMRCSEIPPPERAIHADESRRQSGQNTSAEMLAPRNVTSPSKSNTWRQSAQTISDDMGVVTELTPSVIGKYHESMLIQGHEDNKCGFSALGQQNTRQNAAQSYGEKDVAAECAVFYASEFMDKKSTLPRISIPQSAHACVEGPVSPWARLASQRNVSYPIQFPVTSTQADIIVYSPTAQLEGESWHSPKPRHRQLLSLHLVERASKARSNLTARSSQWSTIPRSRSSASIRMYGGETVVSPRCASADPGDLMSPSSAETLRDGRPQIITGQGHTESADAVHEAAFNREKALRKLNGEVGV